jgi:UDP-glucose 4-epimerase
MSGYEASLAGDRPLSITSEALDRPSYLVTGGAGFVGSHTVLALIRAGRRVVVLDNLSTGHRAAVPDAAEFVLGDVGDAATLDAAFGRGKFDAVLHFAALSLVGESMRDPLRYLRVNAGDGFGLIEACVRHGVPRFVLSSTAAVYGDAASDQLGEDAPLNPTSAYGESKRMLEQGLLWAGRVHGLRSVALRYFNAAGAETAGALGEDHAPETHLIPLTIDAALGRRPPLVVYGDDYPTEDGTCVRDYIHVDDLAHAHLAALDLEHTGFVAMNVGTGSGHSVRAVLRAVERAVGNKVPHTIGPRRPGDPARLVASPARLMAATGWAPRLSDLDTIVATAAAWRVAHPDGYGD